MTTNFVDFVSVILPISFHIDWGWVKKMVQIKGVHVRHRLERHETIKRRALVFDYAASPCGPIPSLFKLLPLQKMDRKRKICYMQQCSTFLRLNNFQSAIERLRLYRFTMVTFMQCHKYKTTDINLLSYFTA